MIHPREVASGAITTGLIILLYFGFTNNTSQIEYIRSEYRNVSIVGTVLALYFVYYMLNNILVLLVALLFPVSGNSISSTITRFICINPVSSDFYTCFVKTEEF